MDRPGFLCIGAQKAGTTWLYTLLREHPDIWLGPFKEYQYFNSLFTEPDRDWSTWYVKMGVRDATYGYIRSLDRSWGLLRPLTRTSNILKYGRNTPHKIDPVYLSYLAKIGDEEFMFSSQWYRHIFSRGGSRLKGDISPAYCSIPAEGVRYVDESLESVPVIYLIRDPLSRALSQLRMNIGRNGVGLPTSRKGWQQLVINFEMQSRGDYISSVTNWMRHYPNQKLLFIPYKDISSEPEDVLRKVERHIGVAAHPRYWNASSKIFEGTKISLPNFVVEMVQDSLIGQSKFLEATFGRDFVSRL
jgi:hypothetical protein